MSRGDRRAEILRAAEKLFASGRFHEVTLDEVAHEARVGKGTIYRYFADKDALFFDTLTAGFDDLCALLDGTVPEEAPFRDQLVSACGAILAFLGDRQQMFRMMQAQVARLRHGDPRFDQQFRAHRRRLVAAVAAIMAKGAAEGAVRRDVPPKVLASVLLAMLHTSKHDAAEFPQEFATPVRLVDLFCQGARPQAESDEGLDVARPEK